MNAPQSVAPPLEARLNADCFCLGIDEPRLWDAIARSAPDVPEASSLRIGREHLFSPRPVFIGKSDLDAMQAVVAAVEAAARLDGYQAAVLARAGPEIQADPGPLGVMMGYDFHLGAEGPRLIEVNTNAGGAWLNALMSATPYTGRDGAPLPVEVRGLAQGFDAAILAMFQSEWRLQGRTEPLRTIAIVDDAPGSQYLLPEFLLARQALQAAGLQVLIADPRDLRHVDGALRLGDAVVDLVYNRLVDFALDEAAHAPLRGAWLAGHAVVTPSPRHHALLADKRNLALLSDPSRLAAWGLPTAHLDALSGVPRAQCVTEANAEALWAARKGLFFKPWAGFGGKAVYRGDKLTRGVWSDILSGGYIAQALALPSERMIDLDEGVAARKLDIRLYTYDGTVLMTAARLYQGQTTNFRTPGGGFAPVLVV